MKNPHLATAVGLLGSALLLSAGGARAQDCLDCHGEPGSTVQFADGETLDVTIDRKAWDASVHGSIGLSCTDCHTDITEYPHPDLRDRTPRDLTLRLYPTCQQCHEEQYKKTLDSVHQQILAAGNKKAAVCADCHDPHAQKRITDEEGNLLPEGRIAIPRTCARCHGKIQAEYRQSVHGAALVDGNPDVPTCIDCHGVHNIQDPRTARFRLESPRLCADCHTNRKKMAKYGISTQVLRTYVADFHGSTVTLFERRHPDQVTNKPVCYDCHGIHDIASLKDPKRSLQIKANLLATCRKCHPDATANFPDAWLSHYIPTRNRYPAVYWARLAYQILIPTVVGGMALFVASDFVRRRIDRRRRLERRHRVEPS
jgi:hypothetical protein